MDPLKSCGVLLFRSEPNRSFLLMRHADRWDLPKGHVDPGETETQCALRELWEETGIEADAIRLDPKFLYTLDYQVRWREAGGQLRDKQLVVFLAELTKPAEIKLTEHLGYQWFDWNPPHRIQEQTIDGLLAAVERMKLEP
jgi:8-oxo-dGTP pyrophosphatase MutT (NUDIX family)